MPFRVPSHGFLYTYIPASDHSGLSSVNEVGQRLSVEEVMGQTPVHAIFTY